MFTKNDRLKALTDATPAVAEMYGSLEIGRLLKNMAQLHTLEADVFVNIVGDIILGLYPKHMLTSLLTEQLGLTRKSAGEIASELGDLLDRIPSAETARDPVPGPQPENTVPDPVPKREEVAKPLTRDELMRALEQRQSGGGGIEAMRQKLEQAANQKTVGYDAMERKEVPEQ